MLMPAPIASQDQKSHVAVILIVLTREMNYAIDNAIWHQVTLVAIVSHDKKSYCTSFQLSWPGKCNGSINDAINIMWCWHWYQGHHMTVFQLSWPKKCNGAIDDAVGIV